MDEAPSATKALLSVLVLAGSLVGLVVGSSALMQSSSDDQIRGTSRGEARGTTPAAPTSHAIGSIVSANSREVIVADVRIGGERFSSLKFGIDSTIPFCRRTCRETWRALRPGDQIDGWLKPLDPSQRRPPHPVYVNFTADHAIVDAIDGNRLTVHSTRGVGPQPPYTLLVTPETIVELRDGSEAIGELPPVEVGEWIYYTGGRSRADRADPTWAYRILY